MNIMLYCYFSLESLVITSISLGVGPQLLLFTRPSPRLVRIV